MEEERVRKETVACSSCERIIPADQAEYCPEGEDCAGEPRCQQCQDDHIAYLLGEFDD